MRRLDEMGALNRAAKALAPPLAAATAWRPAGRAARLLENYLAILQGKGSGSGWDLQGELAVAARLVRRPAPVLFDVGANRGAWALGMEARLAHLQPRLFLFEPARACHGVLRALPLANAMLIGAAVGEAPGEATLLSDAPGSETASLYARRESYLSFGAGVQSEPVPIVTLDLVIEGYGIECVDFVKLDVEGGELQALHGAKRALAAGRIRALSFEFGSGQMNTRTFFHDFWDFLHPLGYTLQRILPGGRVLAIDSYYEDLEHFRGVSNYLAIRQGDD